MVSIILDGSELEKDDGWWLGKGIVRTGHLSLLSKHAEAVHSLLNESSLIRGTWIRPYVSLAIRSRSRIKTDQLLNVCNPASSDHNTVFALDEILYVFVGCH